MSRMLHINISNSASHYRRYRDSWVSGESDRMAGGEWHIPDTDRVRYSLDRQLGLRTIDRKII